jgi:hypothetical protein
LLFPKPAGRWRGPPAKPTARASQESPESKEESDLLWTRESESKEESDLIWTQESESKEEPDLLWTRESESKEESDLIWTQESESKEESDLLWTQESEFKEEPDLLWTRESNGPQIQIQNQMDTVRFLALAWSPPTAVLGEQSVYLVK